MNRTARRLSRRDFLRATAAGAVGLTGAQLLGCGEDNEPAAPTATAEITPSTPTAMPATGALGWRRLTQAGNLPIARRDHSLVTDGERLYLFGGRSGDSALADVWVYDIAANTWEELNAPGPAARFGHNATGDTGRMLVFGGQAGGDFFSDLWELGLFTGHWQQLVTGGPSARYGAAAALDQSGRLLVTHGFTTQGRFDDTWAYHPTAETWTDLSPPGDRPIERCLMRAVWDGPRDRLIMFGGQTNETPFLGDTWALTSAGWVQLPQMRLLPSLPPRNFYAMVWDGVSDRALLFGGNTEAGLAGDLWAFYPGKDSWSEEPVEGEAPSPRAGHDAAFAAGALYVFGGYDGASELNDLWVLRDAP